MKLLCGLLVLISAISLNNAASDTTLKRIATDQLLVDHLMRATAENPSYALECFNLYMPIFDAILQEWSTSYELCISTADNETSLLDSEATANQTLITTDTHDVCNSMINCSTLEYLPFFDCYAVMGGTSVKTLYNLKNTAIDVAAYIREQVQVIEYDMKSCQNASERAYVTATAGTTEALTYCLKNGPPEVVTTTTTTTTTAKNEGTTIVIDIVTSTTEAITTEEVVQEQSALEDGDLSNSAALAPLIKDTTLKVGG